LLSRDTSSINQFADRSRNTLAAVKIQERGSPKYKDDDDDDDDDNDDDDDDDYKDSDYREGGEEQEEEKTEEEENEEEEKKEEEESSAEEESEEEEEEEEVVETDSTDHIDWTRGRCFNCGRRGQLNRPCRRCGVDNTYDQWEGYCNECSTVGLLSQLCSQPSCEDQNSPHIPGYAQRLPDPEEQEEITDDDSAFSYYHHLFGEFG
jgi:hypothetical protein